MAKVFGLTGGIASGKTVIADRLGQLGAVIIDSDLLAREVVKPASQGLRQIVEHFGDHVINAQGFLDRKLLGQLIFSDDKARAALNAITHPLIRQAADQIVHNLGSDEIAIQVIPLLVETKRENDFASVIVVDIEPELQLQRLMKRNGLTKSEAQARIAAQASRQQRIAIADYVIDNSGCLGDTMKQVDQLWPKLQGH